MCVHIPYRCAASNTGEDFRPLFDNFVQDLLSTLHLPEWPASDILLARLGGLLVQYLMTILLYLLQCISYSHMHISSQTPVFLKYIHIKKVFCFY